MGCRLRPRLKTSKRTIPDPSWWGKSRLSQEVGLRSKVGGEVNSGNSESIEKRGKYQIIFEEKETSGPEARGMPT